LARATTTGRGAQIKANLFEPPLGKSDNNWKGVEAIEALLGSESEIAKERGTNTNSVIKVFIELLKSLLNL